jgi:molybdenum cofactor cytidylyltransferase
MTTPTSLVDAFELHDAGELVALVGGGGKTTLMFALARHLVAAGKRVAVTTTTRIFARQMALAPAVRYVSELLGPTDRAASAAAVLAADPLPDPLTLVSGNLLGDKARGVPIELPAWLLARPDVDTVLVEADGAKMRPIKAPAPHEPAIPPEATLVIPVVGIDALDAPIVEVAHRPDVVRRLTRRAKSQYLAPVDVAVLLTHPEGGLKNVPPGARVIPFLNKVEDEAHLALAQKIGTLVVRHPRMNRVVAGAAAAPDPVRWVATA